MSEKKEAFRVLICYLVLLLGLFVIANTILTVLLYYDYVDFVLDQGFIQTFVINGDGLQIFPAVVFYLIGDGILIIGSKIGGGFLRFPRYGNPLKTIFWGAILLIILPFYTAIKLAIELVKLFFQLLGALFTSSKKNNKVSLQKKSQNSSVGNQQKGKSGGVSRISAKVRDICARYERANQKSIGAGTRVYCTIRPRIIMNSVELDVNLYFSVNSNYVQNEYDAQKEDRDIQSFVDGFPTRNLQNEILSAIDSLQNEYSDIYGEWRVVCDVNSDTETV